MRVSYPSPNNVSMLQPLPEKRAKSTKKIQSSFDFYVSGDLLFFKFCQHNVDLKHIDMCIKHLWSKVVCGNELNTLLHALCNDKR